MYTNNHYKKTNAGTNYFTVKEEKKLFATVKSRKGKLAERDYFLLEIFRATALRKTEAISLNVGDVLHKTEINVTERIACKGGTRKVPIKKDVQKLIGKFVKLKQKWGEDISDDAPLFVSRKHQRLAARTVNDIFKKWCKEAGIPIYTPHALRHTKSHRIMEDVKYLSREQQMKKLLYVKKLLGHRSITSTTIYLEPTKEEMELVAEI